MAEQQEHSASIDEVNSAIQNLMTQGAGGDEAEPETEPTLEQPATDQVEKTSEQAELAPEGDVTAPEKKEPPAAPTDDIESLKARLAEKDQEVSAIKEKATRSIQWGRDLALRKSTELERYKTAVEKFRRGEQMTVEDLDRIIGSAPAQTPGQPASPWTPSAPAAPPDELAMQDADAFAIDHGLHGKRGEDFTAFMQSAGQNMTPDQLQRLASLNSIPNNTYAVLQYAHSVWQAAQAAQTAQTVHAARVIQKVQKETMRAAGTATGRARPAPPADKGPDFSKMTPDERLNKGFVDQWLKDLVNQ